MLTKLLRTNAHTVLALSVIGVLGALTGLGDVSSAVAVPLIVAAAGTGTVAAVAGQATTTPKAAG